MTQWVYLWDSCPWRRVIYTPSHDTSSFPNIFRVIRKDAGDESAAQVMRKWRWVRARSPGDERVAAGSGKIEGRLRHGGWGGRCRVTAGCRLTWALTTSVGARHRSREHPRDRENVTRDNSREFVTSEAIKIQSSDHKTSHGVKVSPHNNVMRVLSIPGIQFFRTIEIVEMHVI